MAVTEVFFLNPSSPYARVPVRRGRAARRQTTKSRIAAGEGSQPMKKKNAASSYRRKAKRNDPTAAAPKQQRKGQKAGASTSSPKQKPKDSTSSPKRGPKRGSAQAAAALGAGAAPLSQHSASRSRSGKGKGKGKSKSKSHQLHASLGGSPVDMKRYNSAKNRIAKLSAELKALRAAGKSKIGKAAFARAERQILAAYKKAKDAQMYASRRMAAADRAHVAMSKYEKGSKAYKRSQNAALRNVSRAQANQLVKLSDAYGISKVNPADDGSRLMTLLPQAGAMVVSLGGIGVLAKMLGDAVAKSSSNVTLQKYAGVAAAGVATVGAYMGAQRINALRPYAGAIFFGGLAATAIHALSAITTEAPAGNDALMAKATAQGGQVTLGQRLGLPIGPMNGLFGVPGEGIGSYRHLNGYVAMNGMHGYVGIPQRAQPVNGYVALNGYNAVGESLSPNTLILGDGRQQGADLRASGALDGNPFGGSLAGNSLQGRR